MPARTKAVAKAATKAKRKPGRPKALNDALRLEICERIAEGETIRQLDLDEHMPAARTIYLALATDEAFSHQYARAREAQLQRWEDELVEIADDSTNDWMLRNHGDNDPVEVPNHDHISRSKVRIETRKWLMSKRMPRKYGERVMQEVTGKDGGPVETKDVSDLDRAKALAALVARVKAEKTA